MDSNIWVEKYRPHEFQDVIGLPSTIPSLVNQTMPNLIFEGKPGTGKTTVARIIYQKLGADVLELNASNERGIETIRGKVFSFVSTLSSNQQIKIVFLDEADYLTAEAQTSLRNMMETYSGNARFIFSCNYINKIIDPIKSRCVVVPFSSPPKAQIVAKLLYILDKENVKFSNEVIMKLVDKKYPDMRGMINFLQGNKDKLMDQSSLQGNSTSQQIFDNILSKKVMLVRETCIKENLDIGQLYYDLYEIVFNSQLTPEKKKAVIKIIAEDYRWVQMVAEPEVLFTGSVIRMMEVI